jgi:hypothetical protein
MGKVGSTTVYESLKRVYPNDLVHHVHFLSWPGIEEAKSYFLTLENPEIPEHIERSQKLRRAIDNNPESPWKVITLVRDPIARDISDFFENVDKYWPELLNERGNLRRDDALAFIRDKFLEYDENTNYTCTWFDKELKRAFGIDVYGYPFDYESGYITLSRGRVDVLVMRLEDLNECFDIALEDFLDLNSIELVRANVGRKKRHAEAYRDIRARLRLPRSVCERIYASKYARHFYSDMKEELIERWSTATVEY